MTWKQGNTKMKELAHSEDSIQAECFAWFHNTYPLCRGLMYHIPNGGLRDKIEANKLKAMGVISGIPDICLAIPSRMPREKITVGLSVYGALYIEMKRVKTGTHSEAQKSVQNSLKEAGNCVLECRTVEDFKKIITEYLEGSQFKYK